MLCLNCGVYVVPDWARCHNCGFLLKNNIEEVDIMSDLRDFTEIPKFEPEQIQMEGEQVKINDILNQEVAFLDIIVLPSNFFEGDYGTVQIMNDLNNKKWFRTSSAVLIKQLTDLKDKKKLPLRSTIRKVKRYFTLS